MFSFLALFLRLFCLLSRQLREQLAGREPVAALAARFAAARQGYDGCAVFFCSSAGEFEQARPLIERLRAQAVYVQVLFFSRSGLKFVQARGETVPCALTPLSDSTWHWQRLLSALQPQLVCVVRHELWPGFLATARQFAPLFLIDASRSLGEQGAARKRWLRARLLQQFARIYTVSTDDSEFFATVYGVAPARLQVVSDTKYDSVLERARSKAGAVASMRAQLDALPQAQPQRRLVLGSAYREDVALLLAALASRGKDASPWQLIVAPHHVDAATLAAVESACFAAGLKVVRYSTLPVVAASGVTPLAKPPAHSANSPAATVQSSPMPALVLVDSIGILSELYGAAVAAWIGGALHRQIHNVLEPACHGLALAFGPFYKNSQEASLMVERGLATVTETPAGLAAWLTRLEHEGASLGAQMTAELTHLAGASDRILADWRAGNHFG